MPQQNKACAICGNEFKPYSEKSKFCSMACNGMNLRNRSSIKLGARVGLLTLIEPCGPARGRVCERWICKCDCGNITQKSKTSLLLNPEMADCGCKTNWQEFIRRPRKITSPEAAFDREVSIFEKKSIKRGLEFSLSRDQIKALFLGDCYYCGAVPSETNDTRRRMVTTRNGIDRINNDIGYLPDNCVSCCYPCNWSKRNYSIEVFIGRCVRVAERHKG